MGRLASSRRPVASVFARLCCGLLACAASCGPPPTEDRADAAVLARGEAVARVGDALITAQAVRSYVALHGVSPRDALRALEDDALLRQAAERAGWAGPSVVIESRTTEQLLAQRVLLDLEREHPLDAPSDEEVAEYLSAHAESIVRDETRDCLQVLVQVPPGASAQQEDEARDYAAAVLAQMAANGMTEVWSAQPPEHRGLRILSQYLPPATRATPIPGPLRELVFEHDVAGPASAPVRTEVGWHALAVTAIHPPITAGSPRALELARHALVDETRRNALASLYRRLSERFPVAVSSRHLEVLLPLMTPEEGSGS
ncbi:MAG: hypothetical protein R3B40_01505 [Polyangiales bacterium]|nr:hypothetical protein [Sandaracinaceae bacterium]